MKRRPLTKMKPQSKVQVLGWKVRPKAWYPEIGLTVKVHGKPKEEKQ